MPDPAVSVVIPTHNRPQRLAAALSALRGQTLGPGSFEVIVVDDGSSAETAEVIDRESARGELGLRSARNPVPCGAAAARNVGWRMARAGLIAFTDDDCRPAGAWLAAGLNAHRHDPGAIIQGQTQPDPEERAAVSPFSHTVSRTQLGPSYETCNIFYPRPLLERLGGFDTEFGQQLWPTGEDTDLAWRALESGCRAVFEPRAVVFHAIDRVGLRGTLALARRWTPTIRVLADHPRARVMLERGVFWNVWHYLLLRSALALAAPPWLRRFVLSRHMLALRHRAREAGAGAWAIPFLLLYDAVETAAIVRGAIRYRTFVL